MPKSGLSNTNRCKLAAEVYQTCLKHTSTFEVGTFGSDLAHLLGAIVTDRFVEKSPRDRKALWDLLEIDFPQEHQVWLFIHQTN